ncbi:MAG: hypothetical protein JSR65_13480, partial [Proteobacteria bacterium]|nr:hypothetical protein [Pseudomonadota bacterium]
TLGAANPSDMGRKATVLDVLARARKLADKELTGDPETAATTQLVLSQTYRALADFTTARDCAIAALQAAERGGDPVLAIDARHDLAAAQFNLGDLKSAAQNATAARTAALAQGTAQQRGNTAVLLGQLASENGDTQAAFDWFDHALVELPPDDVKNRAAALNNYGVALHVKGDDVAALAKYREAIALAAGAHMDSDPVAITQYGNFAAALRANGKLDEAVDVLTGKVLPKQIELLGENSADVVWTLSNLATIEYERKNPAAMLDYAQRGYLAAEHLADADEWKALGFKKYGLSLIRAHRAQEAVPILERALALSRQGLPEGHYDIGSLESWLGLARSMTGDRTGGEALARGAYARLLAKYGEKNESTRIAKKNLDAIAALPVP